MSATQPVPPMTDRLAAIVALLAGCVAEQGCLRRVAGALVIAIWTRLHRISAHFRAVAATPLPPPRPARPDPPPRATAPHPAPSPRRPTAMAHDAGWLVRLMPGTAASRSQLEALLRDPEMAALLAADPRLGRILRPLCWMLGVHRSLAPPARRRRKPPAAERPPAASAGAANAPPQPRPKRARITPRAREPMF